MTQHPKQGHAWPHPLIAPGNPDAAQGRNLAEGLFS